jgi:hypothetical protein
MTRKTKQSTDKKLHFGKKTGKEKIRKRRKEKRQRQERNTENRRKK